MKKKILFLIMFIPVICLAAPDTTVSYKGVNTFTNTTTIKDTTYTSSNGNENALLIKGGTLTLNNCTINKTGSSNGDEADFYGTNAAVLAYNNSVLNITGGTINTNGGHANALFAYNTGKIVASNLSIETSSNNSGGLMVTGGGTLTADNTNVTTAGNSSAAIRSDRGGGTLTVNKGTYKTTGVGSPAIYSTANVVVNDATLVSTKSEGAIVEGANSITLNNVNLTDTNNTLNGQSETYKNIFLYQSMSGDAASGVGTFKATNSTITTNKGDTIFVTNTRAVITLTNNTVTNNDGDFLRIQSGKWGNSGSNGGKVTLNLSNQEINGNIIVDKISTLTLNVKEKSLLKGEINNQNSAKSLILNLSKDSTIVLEKDSYITSLTNEDTTNSNIYLNGHKLYVNGEEVSANTESYGTEETEDIAVANKKETTKTSEKEDYTLYYIVLGSILGVILILSLYITMKVKTRNKMN